MGTSLRPQLCTCYKGTWTLTDKYCYERPWIFSCNLKFSPSIMQNLSLKSGGEDWPPAAAMGVLIVSEGPGTNPCGREPLFAVQGHRTATWHGRCETRQCIASAANSKPDGCQPDLHLTPPYVIVYFCTPAYASCLHVWRSVMLLWSTRIGRWHRPTTTKYGEQMCSTTQDGEKLFDVPLATLNPKP